MCIADATCGSIDLWTQDTSWKDVCGDGTCSEWEELAGRCYVDCSAAWAALQNISINGSLLMEKHDAMGCMRRKSFGECSTQHPLHLDMRRDCAPICGLCEATYESTCDARCETYACSEFECGAVGMSTPSNEQGLFIKNLTCDVPGTAINDGFCDEVRGICLPGTDMPDCAAITEKDRYRYDLWTYYFFVADNDAKSLVYFPEVASKSDKMCKQITILQKCAGCSADFYKCAKMKDTTAAVPNELRIVDVCHNF
eukprot:SAG31_NODE_2812_length_5052_cov_2.155663_1_plen_254_part_10